MNYFIWENAYWESPDDEPIPEGAIIVPQRPGPSFIWENNQWIWSPMSCCDTFISPCLDEIERTNKFCLSDCIMSEAVQNILENYRSALKTCVNSPQEGQVLPDAPPELTDMKYFEYV